MKAFEKWETEEVERTFGISFLQESESMHQWLAYRQDLLPKESERMEVLRKKIQLFANFWNEEDLKVFFIIPIIEIVDFYAPNKYRAFMEATFQAELVDANNEPCVLRGRVEMVVATGKQRPQTPFFFLNEYKPQIKAQSDPQGQVLSAMLAAQAKNKALNLPIYGLYTIGQNWFFLLLKGKEYAVSRQFDSTDQDDLKQIINMLQFVKQRIEENI